MVDDVKAGKTVLPSVSSEKTPDDTIAALVTAENNIFLEHKDIWDKVFGHIEKSNIELTEGTSYADFLNVQVEALKNSFTKDELNTLHDDINRIDEIEKQLQELERKQ